MKLTIDHEADALYLNLSNEPAHDSEEVSPGIIIDYNRNGQAVGVELLQLSKRASTIDCQSLLYETIPHAKR